MTILVGRCLEKKTMLVWVKEYIRKNFVTCKNLCYLQELHATFKEKQPNVYIRFSKFCTLRPKWRVLAVCVCSAHQNFMLLVDTMEWDLTYKDLIKKIVCNPGSNKCIGVASAWILFLLCNSQGISQSGTQGTWRWWGT